MFEQILDIVGSRDQWPPDVIRYFWRLTPRGSDYLDYSERFRLSVFMYVNEVPFEMFYNWCLRVNLLRDRAAREHISRLYSTFQYDYKHGVNRYASWNVRMGVDLYCSGERHYYNP